MSKSFRSFVLVALLAVAAVPSLHADRTGCNPHPQVVTTQVSPAFQIIYSVLSGLSF